jgi:hypothetical protein
MKPAGGAGSARLPVDPERLRKEFPALTAADLDAYVTVTRRILETPPAERSRVTREALEGGRRALEKAARGETLGAAEAVLARYVEAVGKMQPKATSGAS